MLHSDGSLYTVGKWDSGMAWHGWMSRAVDGVLSESISCIIIRWSQRVGGKGRARGNWLEGYAPQGQGRPARSDVDG